jgi:flagella basal body P-ring formation protein FlgA
VKKVFVFLLMANFLNADMALVSVKDIKYKQLLDYGDLKKTYIDKKIRCQIFDKNELLDKEYRAKRYILKGTAICYKDVEVAKRDKIKFDFGNIVIERDGKVIGETKQYIKVKNSDGSVDRIYKNGQNK